MSERKPFDSAPRDGTAFRALSGRTDCGQLFRWVDGEFWQWVRLRNPEIALSLDAAGTWHRPFFIALHWMPADHKGTDT
jgi:hypothetical protein